MAITNSERVGKTLDLLKDGLRPYGATWKDNGTGHEQTGDDRRNNPAADLGEFMKRWPDTTRSLITGRNPMTAYRDLLLGAPNGIKETITLTA